MAVDNPAGQRELRPRREARRHRVRGAHELALAGSLALSALHKLNAHLEGNRLA
jgi:hypothetical protein